MTLRGPLLVTVFPDTGSVLHWFAAVPVSIDTHRVWASHVFGHCERTVVLSADQVHHKDEHHWNSTERNLEILPRGQHPRSRASQEQ